jgi:hypothetical protein
VDEMSVVEGWDVVNEMSVNHMSMDDMFMDKMAVDNFLSKMLME